MTMPVYMVDSRETDCIMEFVSTQKTLNMVTQLLTIAAIIDMEGDSCAVNDNAVVTKRPFNPFIATYVWENWQD